MNFRQWLRNAVRLLVEILPLEQYRKIDTWLRKRYEETKMPEVLYGHFVHRKKGAKEKYVICRFGMANYGIMATALQGIFVTAYMEKKGYIPVIDLEWMDYLAEGVLGKDNAWEYCFKQPVSVKEALTKDWVYVDTVNSPHAYLRKMCRELNGDGNDSFLRCKDKEWRQYYEKSREYAKRFWKWQGTVSDIGKDFLREHLTSDESFVAVMMREDFSEDVIRLRGNRKEVYDRHPFLPSIGDTIQLVKKKTAEWKCSKIFLSTIVIETVQRFQEEFGAEKIFCVPRHRNPLQGYAMNEFHLNKEEHKQYIHQTNPAIRGDYTSYTAELLVAAKADYLIGAPSSGTAAALVMNGGKYRDIVLLEDRNPNSRQY